MLCFALGPLAIRTVGSRPLWFIMVHKLPGLKDFVAVAQMNSSEFVVTHLPADLSTGKLPSVSQHVHILFL